MEGLSSPPRRKRDRSRSSASGSSHARKRSPPVKSGVDEQIDDEAEAMRRDAQPRMSTQDLMQQYDEDDAWASDEDEDDKRAAQAAEAQRLAVDAEVRRELERLQREAMEREREAEVARTRKENERLQRDAEERARQEADRLAVETERREKLARGCEEWQIREADELARLEAETERREKEFERLQGGAEAKRKQKEIARQQHEAEELAFLNADVARKRKESERLQREADERARKDTNGTSKARDRRSTEGSGEPQQRGEARGISFGVKKPRSTGGSGGMFICPDFLSDKCARGDRCPLSHITDDREGPKKGKLGNAFVAPVERPRNMKSTQPIDSGSAGRGEDTGNRKTRESGSLKEGTRKARGSKEGVSDPLQERVLPKGWYATEHTHGSESVYAGRTYLKYHSADGKHKNVSTRRMAFKLDAKRRGIDVEAALQAFDDMMGEG